MTTLREWAQRQPGKPAYTIADTGEHLTYAELDRRADAGARWMASAGLAAGDVIAVLMENGLRLLEIAWAAKRAGVYYTLISRHLQADEIAYILDNSEARWLLSSAALTPVAGEARHRATARDIVHYGVGVGASDAVCDYDQAISACTHTPDLSSRPVGREMLYSSGTTGRPKGVCKPMLSSEYRGHLEPDIALWQRIFDVGADSVYLSTGPLYHAAPHAYCMRTVACGGHCVVMKRFDAEAALAAIETYRVTHSQWVPTMFVRLLDLPAATRRRYDLSSLRYAIHAAAPCPIHVKEQMLAWWGAVVWEYYAGSEGIGQTVIGPAEWRQRKGSVGRPTVGELHILDDDGRELPPGEIGTIYFANGPRFEYRNDPEKTASVYRDDGMATLGDLGHVDEAGYLYISDRRADLIISGGVNIYPKEIEEVLHRHAQVGDCAVVGVPDPEYGEAVLACVLPCPGVAASEALASDLVAHCREALSHVKVPRRIEFLDASPRQENGKIPRRLLKARYRSAGNASCGPG
ncbi:acyl-CoA synthetase [Salinisphaera orenii MK-B5]|uniref:Acyl-CoA synthetase n=1 Tax=Salinisphaera orenii MK-B5 TaxID=856730 RepID=A0A423PGB5_9GAMM|nr:AMP-binding protein [Salinisphaera orenii]ROO24526.1 acyl-CoA synthetase [Salinisphaera orenii MK-B5]